MCQAYRRAYQTAYKKAYITRYAGLRHIRSGLGIGTVRTVDARPILGVPVTCTGTYHHSSNPSPARACSEEGMDESTSFGAWLKQRRKALDLTQEELARHLGCATVTLQKIELDERRPSKDIAERLAVTLEIAPEERPTFLKVARAELSVERLSSLPAVPADQPAPHPPLPSGTVTWLFTDLEQSTVLWEHHPQAMATALDRHDALLREAIQAYGGTVVKATGDGVHAAFAIAPAALAAVLAAQRALQREPWGDTGPLRVRMALHTGAAEERAGDYYGPAVNRTARLLAVGHGGQVLLSHTTADLVRDQLPDGVAVQDLGLHRLKDLQRPEHTFQLGAPDLPSDFPPLTTLDARPNNLPVQRDPLIGREQEVAAVLQLLRRTDVGLVTLTGSGGTGKTRLALQVATDLLDAFPDGVWFVDLAPITDPALVVSTIAHTLGITEVGGHALGDTLTASLRDKHLLLLLDNFEQVAAPALTVLVTSRAPLHLSGEHEVPVPPLALPDPTQPPTPARLAQSAAVALFIARAQAVTPAFQLTPANAAAVAEICLRLDGLPLAIELAAMRTKLFAPDALLARLQRRLPLLTGGARDLPARQQTLRATLDWSYHLLSPAEQRLFTRLAVFTGGWTVPAVASVCTIPAEPELDVV